MKSRGLSILKNSTWSLVDVFLVTLIGFASNIMMARIMGPENLGLYSYIVTSAGLIVALASSGISTYLVRESVKKPWKLASYVNATLSIFIFYSLPIIGALTWVGYSIFEIAGANQIILGVLFQVAMMFFGFFIMFFISIARSDVSSLLNIAFKIGFGLTLLAFLFLQFEQVDVSTILAISFLWLVLFLVVAILSYYKLTGEGISLRPKLKLYRVYVLASYPILGAALAEFINLKIDTLMLGNMRGNVELGFYTASYNLYIGFTLVALALTKVYSPVFIRQAKDNKLAAKKLLIKYGYLYSVYSILVLLFLFYFASFLVTLLYGEEYFNSGIILTYLAFALPFINLNRLVNYSIIGVGGQTNYFYFTVIGSIVNISVNFYLIPIYGALGAVVATMLTEALVLVLGTIFLVRYFKN